MAVCEYCEETVKRRKRVFMTLPLNKWMMVCYACLHHFVCEVFDGHR